MRNINIGSMYVVVPGEYVSQYDRLYLVASAPGYAGETFTLTVDGGETFTYVFDSYDTCEVDIASLLINGSNTLTLTDSGGTSDSVTVNVSGYVPPLFGMEHPCSFALCQPSDAVVGDSCVWMSKQAATITVGGTSVSLAAGEYKALPYSSAWTANGRTYYAHTLQGCEDTVRLNVRGNSAEYSRWKIKDNTLNITDITNLDSVSALDRMSGVEESITIYKDGLNSYDVGYYSRLLQYDNDVRITDTHNTLADIPCRFSTKKSVIPNGNAGRFTLELDVIVNIRKPL
jgi:hypothetical protein